MGLPVGLPTGTPHTGILHEMEIIPIMKQILYQKLMLYHNLINSDERRVAKVIVQEQEKRGHKENWYGNLREESEKIGLNVSEQNVKGKIKSVWKKEIKEKIKESVKEERKIETDRKKKLRFIRECSAVDGVVTSKA